jgi:hypothetical protein
MRERSVWGGSKRKKRGLLAVGEVMREIYSAVREDEYA